jgi:hypothetical protein
MVLVDNTACVSGIGAPLSLRMKESFVRHGEYDSSNNLLNIGAYKTF